MEADGLVIGVVAAVAVAFRATIGIGTTGCGLAALSRADRDGGVDGGRGGGGDGSREPEAGAGGRVAHCTTAIGGVGWGGGRHDGGLAGGEGGVDGAFGRCCSDGDGDGTEDV